MSYYNKVVFVSSSDTCRGPMAAGIMRSMLVKKPLEIRSRGLVVLFPEPPNQKAVAIMKSNRLEIDGHVSILLSEEDLAEDCLVLVMEEQQKQKILELHEDASNVYTLTEAVGEEGDIPDPYGGELKEYGACYEKIYAIVEKFVEIINREEI
ncbi:arsenate reductase/protein-tyrosine-phosphatase family protein [Anaerobium acetethylicum]|uniref:Protein-tyrosine phosphatase n=1 Tax=Anaerobium acetethylicum TaxID=1619234 RepID=A0A1D3TRI8_9FIRM|nr:phosphotyrosine protein phosphatase [Anaerobium acetethylicum]SCP96320.1 protein-tyrosine phosphatase [Anaerobium acetethylicum]